MSDAVVPAGYVPARAVPANEVRPVIPPTEQVSQPLPPPRTGSYGPVMTDFTVTLEEVPDGAIQRLPVEKLLAAALPWYTPGGSLMGWSKLKQAKLCLRSFYYSAVLGLVLRREPTYVTPETAPLFFDDDAPEPVKGSRREYISPLDLGTLVHACIECWYRTGDDQAMWAPAEAVKQHHPATALEAHRLVNFYLRRYVEDEALTWDNRAVERESRYWFPPRKCGGKRRSLCVSARHDGIYRPIQPGEARLPPGTAARNGVMIHELKCLSIDEPLWDAARSLRVNAGTLLDMDTGRLPTVNLHTNSLGTHAALFTDNGLAPVHQIVLSSGRGTKLTNNHPVWTSTGWKAAGELLPGDWVGCAPIEFVGEDRLTPTEVELLGYFLGDGYMNPESPALSTGRPDLMARVCTLLTRTGSDHHVSPGDDRHVPACRVHKNTPFNSLLKQLRLHGCLAAEKFIPEEIMGATREQVVTLLAALWSTDGSINGYDYRATLDIHYDTMSPTLARDVQQLLWRLGIWSGCHAQAVQYKDWAERGKDSHSIKIAGREAKRRFLSTIFPRMICRTELTAAEADAMIPKRGRGKTTDVIPRNLVQEILTKTTAAFSGNCRRMLQLRADGGVSRWVVHELAKIVPELADLVNSPLHWDRVKLNLPLGKLPTVAVTVPEQPVFLTGDGLVTHNTTASLTYNRTRGFMQNAQVMMGLLTYNRGHAVRKDGTVLSYPTAALFGPAEGITVTWIGKTVRLDTQKDIDRMNYQIPSNRLDVFVADLEDWYYEEIGDRLFSTAYQHPETWRKDWLCSDIHFAGSICPFLSVCEVDGQCDLNVFYEQIRPLNRDLLEKPKTLLKVDKAKAKAAATVEGK